MGVTDQRRVGRALRACIEQRFQSSCWTFEEERLDARILGHSNQIT